MSFFPGPGATKLKYYENKNILRMTIFTQLRINLLFSATKLFSQIWERSQLSKILFNDVCGIVELSCVEDKEELVNIGKMKVFSIFHFLKHY